MRRTWLLFSQAVTVALACLFVVSTLKPEWLGGDRRADAVALPMPTLRTAAPPAPVASDALMASGYADAAELAAPAVVSIVASKMLRSDPPVRRPQGTSGLLRPSRLRANRRTRSGSARASSSRPRVIC